MAEDFIQIKGPESLAALGKALRSMGDGRELRKEFLRTLRETGKPVSAKVKTALGEELPHRGGASRLISGKTRVGVRNRLTGKDAGVRLEVKKKGTDMPSLDRGRLRHPLFGNRQHWFDTDIKPDIVTHAVEECAPEMQRQVLQAIDNVTDKIVRAS